MYYIINDYLKVFAKVSSVDIRKLVI